MNIVAVGASSFAEADKTPLLLLEAAGLTVRINPFGRKLTAEETVRHLEGAVGLLAGLEPLNREVLAACPMLKALARIGIGMDNVDAAAAAELGIRVSNTPEPPAVAVAEMTLAALLSLCRRLPESNAALHAGRWEKALGRSLSGANVLVVGFGRIGRRVGELVKAFGANILAADPFLDPTALPPWARAVSLDEGLALADVITLHASGKGTLLGVMEFSRMKPGTIVLNAARGGLIDEAALLLALESGAVSRVWCDTFAEEPYNGPLIGHPRALLTPHAATYTAECRLEMETEAARNLLRDLGLSA